jgi:hypothetical protein
LVGTPVVSLVVMEVTEEKAPKLFAANPRLVAAIAAANTVLDRANFATDANFVEMPLILLLLNMTLSKSP